MEKFHFVKLFFLYYIFYTILFSKCTINYRIFCIIYISIYKVLNTIDSLDEIVNIDYNIIIIKFFVKKKFIYLCDIIHDSYL